VCIANSFAESKGQTSTKQHPDCAKPNLLRVYEVNRKAGEFPEKEDLSTPEAVYASILRVIAQSGEEGLQQISAKETDKVNLSLTGAKEEKIEPDVAKEWLNAKILEVRIFKNRYSVIIAELLGEDQVPSFDFRSVYLEKGKWLNAGHKFYPHLDYKEMICAKSWSKYADKPAQPKIDDPESYLRTFIDFLKTNAEEPNKFVMKALAKYKVTIIGEIHHRPRYWAFCNSLMTDPDFPKYVGTIYLELQSNDQELIDKFLAAKKCDTTPVIEMLRNMQILGWPDQAMLDFFVTVWTVNQNLPEQQKIRIVLPDRPRPWKKIEKSEDWLKIERFSRDRVMGDNILADIREHPNENRNSLFIVGVMHAGLNLKYFEGSPVKTAGWYLREELGQDKVYAIFQHQCVVTNDGRMIGRLRRGLFDSAFAAVANKPMAFSLDVGPFGKELFEASPPFPPMASSCRDGYNAYLYLGPLGTEIFSPLIEGFYTDEFAKEVDRRYRIMRKQGWAERFGQNKTDGKTLTKLMSRDRGKPRSYWQENSLGSMDAWKIVDRSEKRLPTKKNN
jgi:hypothetical protein